MKDFKNILVVRTDRIGDVVLTTPSIRALKNKYPNGKITVLVSAITYDLVNGLPFIDTILIDDKKGIHSGVLGFLRLVRSLAKERFDLCVVYHTKKRTNLLCYLAGIPYRLGYKNNKYGFLLNHPVADQRHLGQAHEAMYCLDLLKDIGVREEDITTQVAINPDAERWLADYVSQLDLADNERLVLIHPAASDPAKQWPAANFSELINILSERNAQIAFVVIGTIENRQIATAILEQTGDQVHSLVGQINLSQLASLLNRADLLVSNDSGPVHIAAALNTAVVSIFTRNQPGINPQRWQPLGENSRVVSVSPNSDVSFKKAQKYDPKKMELIPTQAVLEAVDSLCKLC